MSDCQSSHPGFPCDDTHGRTNPNPETRFDTRGVTGQLLDASIISRPSPLVNLNIEIEGIALANTSRFFDLLRELGELGKLSSYHTSTRAAMKESDV